MGPRGWPASYMVSMDKKYKPSTPAALARCTGWGNAKSFTTPCRAPLWKWAWKREGKSKSFGKHLENQRRVSFLAKFEGSVKKFWLCKASKTSEKVQWKFQLDDKIEVPTECVVGDQRNEERSKGKRERKNKPGLEHLIIESLQKNPCCLSNETTLFFFSRCNPSLTQSWVTLRCLVILGHESAVHDVNGYQLWVKSFNFDPAGRQNKLWSLVWPNGVLGTSWKRKAE